MTTVHPNSDSVRFQTIFLAMLNALNLVVNTTTIQLVDTTDTYSYFGYAAPGTATSAASWQIKRLDILGNILYAAGTANYSQVWNNRQNLSYS